MDNKKLQIDQTKLTPDQRTQLENYQNTQTQLQTLKDIADMTQEMLGVLDSQKQGDETNDKQMGALLMDMRDSLTVLKDKKTPETPDYAKPVVDAVKGLETALSASIKAIDVKPNVTLPAPNIPPPVVDLKGVEKAVSNLSKSFQDAIKLINIPEAPEPDFQPLLDAWSGISEQLVSIENATRMKPLPGTMKVTNPDGTNIGGTGLTNTELRATPVPTTESNPITGFATSAKQDTQQTTLTSIDTNVALQLAPGKLRYTNIISASTTITPTTGKSIKVIKVQVVPASANASDVQMYLHFATSSIDVFKGYAGGGYGVFTGAVNEVLTVTQTGTGSVQVLVDYNEV